MVTNFDKTTYRKGTNSVKWDLVDMIFKGDDLLPMWVADMDFESPECVKESILDIANKGIFGYSACLEKYYNSIVKWYYKRHSTIINNDWISYTPGTVTSLNMLIQSFTREGDGIIVQQPVYYPFFNSILNNNRKVVNNPLRYNNGRYNIDFDHLNKIIEEENPVMMILCSPHNPVGRVWEKEELTTLSYICNKHNIFVISDEVHSDLVLFDNKHLPYIGIDTANILNSATCISPSKSFNMAGLHISNVIIADSKKREIFRSHLNKCGIEWPNIFATEIQSVVYEKGDLWLKDLIAYIESNMLYLDSFLKLNMPEIHLVKPEATYLAWLDFRNLNKEETEINKILINESKIALDYGSMFGKEGNGFQRINVACSQELLKKALENINNTLFRK